MAQVEECLPCKCKAPSSNTSSTKKKRKEKFFTFYQRKPHYPAPLLANWPQLFSHFCFMPSGVENLTKK
jgi:hypothetical protein